jgi:hypothetical protein
MREPRFGNDGLDKYDLDPAPEKHPPRLIVSDRPWKVSDDGIGSGTVHAGIQRVGGTACS